MLSKGHSAGAYYITLWTLGKLVEEDLRQFHKDGTRLSGHPPASGIAEIEFATGSLGHGLGFAAGLALAKQLKSEPGRVYCLMLPPLRLPSRASRGPGGSDIYRDKGAVSYGPATTGGGREFPRPKCVRPKPYRTFRCRAGAPGGN